MANEKLPKFVRALIERGEIMNKRVNNVWVGCPDRTEALIMLDDPTCKIQIYDTWIDGLTSYILTSENSNIEYEVRLWDNTGPLR